MYVLLVRIAIRALCLGYYTHREKEGFVNDKNAYSEYVTWMNPPTPDYAYYKYMIWMKPHPLTTPIMNM